MKVFRHPGFASLALVCFLVIVASPVSAKIIHVFDNPAYVDTSGGPSSESDTVQAALIALGHTVVTFTGVDAASWTAASAGDAILIPETETGQLHLALDGAAITAINNAVSGGTGFIAMGGVNTGNLVNTVFGFSVGATGAFTTSDLQTATAAGTAFDGGPASLSNTVITSGVQVTTLPAGASNFYQQDDVVEDLSTVVGWKFLDGSGATGIAARRSAVLVLNGCRCWETWLIT